jgi:hypothetical protein
MNFATQTRRDLRAIVITGYFARAGTTSAGPSLIAAIVLAIGIAGYILGLGKLRVIPEPA